MKELMFQIEIFRWHLKNSKTVYLTIAILFLVLLPILGLMFRLGAEEATYRLMYDYTIYLAETMVSVLGFLPFLIVLYGVIHQNAGECMMLCSAWKERKQQMICYGASVLVLAVFMFELGIIFLGKVKAREIFGDFIDLAVILWVSDGVSHLLARVFQNIFVSLILMEFYGVLCRLMGIGITSMWNIYSLDHADGLHWGIQIFLYIMIGIFAEYLISRIITSHFSADKVK
jgi:hypothetical protein